MNNITQAELELTGRKLASLINGKIATARKERNILDITFWQTMDFMHKRQSMKVWSLAQLVERYETVNSEVNLTVQTLTV